MLIGTVIVGPRDEQWWGGLWTWSRLLPHILGLLALSHTVDHHLKRHQTSDMGTIAGGGKHKEMIRSVGAHSYYSYSYNIEKHSIAGLSGG